MKKQELGALTGLRFYAALLVYRVHATFLPGMGWFAASRFSRLGELGVSMFFTLSGFVLTYNYRATLAEGLSSRAYLSFLWNRFAKLYPLHLLALALVIPACLRSPTLPLDWRALPWHLTLTQSWAPFATPPFVVHFNTPAWSISCEAFFYLLTPILLGVILRRPLSRAGLAAFGTGIVAMILGWAWVFQNLPSGAWSYFCHYFAPARLPEFLAGVLAAVVFEEHSGALAAGASWLQAVGLLLLGLATAMEGVLPGYCVPSAAFIPGASLLILGLASGRTVLSGHLQGTTLRLLGNASYAFYLFHLPIIRYIKGGMVTARFATPGAVVGVAIALGCLLASQAIAVMLHNRVELPMQRRLRGWFRAVDGTGRRAGAPVRSDS